MNQYYNDYNDCDFKYSQYYSGAKQRQKNYYHYNNPEKIFKDYHYSDVCKNFSSNKKKIKRDNYNIIYNTDIKKNSNVKSNILNILNEKENNINEQELKNISLECENNFDKNNELLSLGDEIIKNDNTYPKNSNEIDEIMKLNNSIEKINNKLLMNNNRYIDEKNLSKLLKKSDENHGINNDNNSNIDLIELKTNIFKDCNLLKDENKLPENDYNILVKVKANENFEIIGNEKSNDISTITDSRTTKCNTNTYTPRKIKKQEFNDKIEINRNPSIYEPNIVCKKIKLIVPKIIITSFDLLDISNYSFHKGSIWHKNIVWFSFKNDYYNSNSILDIKTTTTEEIRDIDILLSNIFSNAKGNGININPYISKSNEFKLVFEFYVNGENLKLNLNNLIQTKKDLNTDDYIIQISSKSNYSFSVNLNKSILESYLLEKESKITSKFELLKSLHQEYKVQLNKSIIKLKS